MVLVAQFGGPRPSRDHRRQNRSDPIGEDFQLCRGLHCFCHVIRAEALPEAGNPPRLQSLLFYLQPEMRFLEGHFRDRSCATCEPRGWLHSSFLLVNNRMLNRLYFKRQRVRIGSSIRHVADQILKLARPSVRFRN